MLIAQYATCAGGFHAKTKKANVFFARFFGCRDNNDCVFVVADTSSKASGRDFV